MPDKTAGTRTRLFCGIIVLGPDLHDQMLPGQVTLQEPLFFQESGSVDEASASGPAPLPYELRVTISN